MGLLGPSWIVQRPLMSLVFFVPESGLRRFPALRLPRPMLLFALGLAALFISLLLPVSAKTLNAEIHATANRIAKYRLGIEVMGAL
ncbi:unnamed protein product [Sphagnum jensenii]|uniref:Uncharacterized protein n=1 Tax=Sphagnum jensenii TaxID=128206 RepID=A0ABP0V5F2_9BRYO